MDNMKACINILSAVVILSIIPEIAYTQAFLKAVNPSDHKGNFQELSRQIDMFYDTATGSNRGGYKQWKRWEWFAMHHLDENGSLGNYVEKNLAAVEEMNRISVDKSRMPTTGEWFNLGHSSTPGATAQQGRVNSIAFDPVNSAIVYVATAGGGIWKTFNNGDTWTNLTIDLPILGVSDIVVSPSPNNHILYALTGDIIWTSNVYQHSSIGIIKSFDSGLTWVRTNLTTSLDLGISGFKLLMHPTNANILLVATSSGIQRTMDGGNTWATIAFLPTVINDIKFKPGDPNILYFTRGNSNNFYTLNLTTNVRDSVFIPTALNVDRMEIAVTPDNVNAVYLLAGPGYLSGTNNLFNGLFYSGNGGDSFTMRTNFCSNNGDLFNSTRSLSFYANTILVDPNEENNVIVGGLWLFNSTDGGVTLNQVTSNSIHADQHSLKRNTLNGDLWLGNDGGVYRSTDNGNTWNDRSDGLVINEYYRISGTNNASDLVLGGTQDNGHYLIDAAGNFSFVLGSDGMDNCFNSFDNTIAYACTQNGGLNRSINYGQNFYLTNLPNAGNPNFYPWITPIVQQPPHFNLQQFQWVNTDVVYVYSLNGVMRSGNNFTWPNIGPSGIGQTAGAASPSMAVGADVDGNTNLYISNGNLFWACFNPTDEVPDWFQFALPISNTTYISAIAVNPSDRREVWATISGYQAGTKVFRSQNGGLTWLNLSLSLPNTPVYSIVFANSGNSPSGAVYVGTEIGVFYTDDGLPDWVPFSNGLPHVPVTDLNMNYTTGELKAATYGRGIWESDLYEPCPLLVLVDYDIYQGQYSFESSNLILANHFIHGGLGTRVHMKAANQVKMVNGFKISAGTYARISIGTCGSGPLVLTEDPSKQAEAEKPKAERN